MHRTALAINDSLVAYSVENRRYMYAHLSCVTNRRVYSTRKKRLRIKQIYNFSVEIAQILRHARQLISGFCETCNLCEV